MARHDAFEQVAYEQRGDVVTITLNRPDRLNATTVRMTDELLEAFDVAEADDETRVIILTGAGRAFSAGMELEGNDRAFNFPDPQNHRDRAADVAIRIYECTRPVIAAINGAAVGMGATMILPADLRIASTSARIGYVFTRRGITPEGSATWFLPRVVGINQAMEWFCTGRVFDAHEALRSRLIRSVHRPEELMDAAYALAGEIAENAAPVCLALTRQMAWRMLGANHPRSAQEVESRVLGFVGAGADAREGVRAFLEKRTPQFRGRISTDMPDFYPWWPQRDFTPLP
jgi:enoyl-CoA hydratase/carnithine racemase